MSIPLLGVLARSALFTVVMPCAVTLYFPLAIAKGTPARFALPHVLGLLPIALGIAAYLWCVWDFAKRGGGTPAPVDPPRTLVVHGLYRHVRNPMYAAVLLVLLGEAALFGSRKLLVYAATVAAGFLVFVLRFEEPNLSERFGEAYEDYRLRVPRFLPRLTPYRPTGS